MKFDLKRPCKDCPFLEGKDYLTRARAAEIARGITDGQATFSCHKLNSFEDNEYTGETDVVEGENAQHCAGALILLERIERPNQLMRIMERIGVYDRRKLDMDAPVYETPEAFIRGHRA